MNANLKKNFIALLVCALMLLNLTSFVAFAVSPCVDAALLWSETENGEWKDGSGAFLSDAFAPGDEIKRYFKVENNGLLAFSFDVKLTSAETLSGLSEIIEVYSAGELKGTLASVINGQAVFSGRIIPEGESLSEGYYSKSAVTEITLKLPENAPAEYMNEVLGEFSVTLVAEECEYTYKTYKKFETKFVNHEKYLYRVGNKNTVALGTLFKAVEGAEIGNVTATVTSLDASSGVKGEVTPNADWTKSTITFSGTGVVEIVITDDFRCEPTSLKVEVINATNLTSAASVKTADAVLLNDAGFSSFDVSGGYTLYGNGFTLTCSKDVYADGINDSFVTVNNGTLDNVRIIVPNFSHAILYNSQKTQDGNPQASYEDCAYNLRNAIVMNGNSVIRNSYVSGGRAAIQIAGSINDFRVENTTVAGGAVANVAISSAKSVTLKDMTLIQKPVKANVNVTENTVMGLSIMAMADSSGLAAPITLEGKLRQYAWANKDYSGYVPEMMQPVISNVLGKTDYIHSVKYSDGVSRDSINLGIFYVPEGVGSSVKKPENLYDNREDKNEISYDWLSASLLATSAYAYTYKNANGTAESYLNEPVYESGAYTSGSFEVKYEELPSCASIATACTDGIWNTELAIDLDNAEGRSFTLDFAKLRMVKHGRNLSYTVKDSSGNAVDTAQPIVFATAEAREYVLEITDNLLYNPDGSPDESRNAVYTYSFKIQSKMTSINAPELVGDVAWGDALLVVKSKNSDWTTGIPASLEGINIKFWNKEQRAYQTINLGSITPQKKGKANSTNNYWEYKDDNAGYTFKVTSGYIHEGKKIYGMPVVVDNSGLKMYFTISGTTGYVSTGTAARAVTLTYVFTDSNGGEWSTSHTWNVKYADLKDVHQYSYSDFVSGNLNDLLSSSSGGGDGCFAEGTPILLADGTYKNIEDLTFNDEIVVWDFFEGKYNVSVPSLLLYDGHKEWDVMNLEFSDNTTLRLIYEHGLFDADANEYVLINPDNIAEQVGKRFVKKDGNTNKLVELTGYTVETEKIGCYTMLAAAHNNCIANGMLTVTPPPVPRFYDYFEIGEDMKYINMEEDIAKYGLYSYEDFEDYITYDAYLAFNGAYLKQCVEKGYFDFDEIVKQIYFFKVAAENASEEQLSIASAAAASEAVTVEIKGNNITSANYSVTLGEADKLVISEKEEIITLKASGNAGEGFAEITFDGVKYYAILNAGEELSLTVKNAVGMEVSVKGSWGKLSDYGFEATVDSSTVLNGGEVTLTYDENESGIYAKLENTTRLPVTGDLYLAIYNQEGKLLECIKTAKNLTVEGKNFFTLESGVKMAEGYSVKVFLWQTGTMKPVN